MNFKLYFLLITFMVTFFASFAQEKQLLVTYKSGKQSNSIKVGDNVRLTYPAGKLGINNSKKSSDLAGFRGVVNAITDSTISFKTKASILKPVIFNIADLKSIKENRKGALLTTFIVTYAVLGTGAFFTAKAFDLNAGFTAFGAAFAAFPSVLLAANVYYPSKPGKSVGEDYTLKVVTIYQ